MKCQDCELLLEEYFDGETDGRATAAVAAHLQTCAACSEIYDGLAAEQSLYASYEREVEVTPALWAGVEARLRAERPEAGGKVGFPRRLSGWLAPLLVAPRFSPALTAAMVVVAVVATAVVMKSVGGSNTKPPQLAQAVNQGGAASAAAVPGGSPTPIPTAPPDSAATPQPAASPRKMSPPPEQSKLQQAAGPAPKQGPKLDRNTVNPAQPGATQRVEQANLRTPSRGEQAAEKLVREAEQRYVAAIRILERDVRGRRPKIDAGTLARFDETLASIDRTIAETRKTARQHGNDPVAVQYMLSAYAKKVEVMREMASLGQ